MSLCVNGAALQPGDGSHFTVEPIASFGALLVSACQFNSKIGETVYLLGCGFGALLGQLLDGTIFGHVVFWRSNCLMSFLFLHVQSLFKEMGETYNALGSIKYILIQLYVFTNVL